jgi:hypothetical protein
MPVELPRPCPWPEPITLDQFIAFTPEKLELASGYLIDEDAHEQRVHLLALLLTNCGLEAAIHLAHRDHWQEALDRAGFNM